LVWTAGACGLARHARVEPREAAGHPGRRAHAPGTGREGFRGNGAAKRLQPDRLPAYAPELNPDEGIRNYLKRVELRNVRCQDLAHLRDELRLAAARLRHKRVVLRACIRQARIVE
jgi:hypothetical protein